LMLLGLIYAFYTFVMDFIVPAIISRYSKHIYIPCGRGYWAILYYRNVIAATSLLDHKPADSQAIVI
jgi:hypothetical protein